MYARRLQVQERLTQQVADFLMERLAPEGVGVVARGHPPVRGDARRAQAGHGDDDRGGPRPVPAQRQDPRRVLRPPRAGRRRAPEPVERPRPRPVQSRHVRPTAQGADRQARPRRPRPGREGARPRAPRRGLRGRLHGPPPDARDGRHRGAPGGRRRRRPVDPVRRAHDARPADQHAARGARAWTTCSSRSAGSSPTTTSQPLRAAGVAGVFGPGTTIREVADFLRANAHRAGRDRRDGGRRRGASVPTRWPTPRVPVTDGRSPGC